MRFSPGKKGSSHAMRKPKQQGPVVSPLRSDQRQLLTMGEFLAADPRSFGNAWRYELIGGRVVAHAAPCPTTARWYSTSAPR